MACEATRRPMMDRGWVCDGEDLVVLLHSATLPPTVIRRGLLPYLANIDREWIRDITGAPEPFAGGDHLHLVLTLPLRRPVPL